MDVSLELIKLVKKTGKPAIQLYTEMKIAKATFYNALMGRRTPTSKLFYEKLDFMKKKYGVK